MRLLRALIPSLLLVSAQVAQAASSWSFIDASISVSSKGKGEPFKDKYVNLQKVLDNLELSERALLSKPVALESGDNLKIILTATEAGKPKRPHQAFLVLRDIGNGLESSFPFSVKDTGKAMVELTQKDLPFQLLHAVQPLQATLLLASFGSSQPFGKLVFNLNVKVDASKPSPKYEKPLRYGKLPEIHHIFKADPKSGPVIISVFFVGAILATVPILLATWAYLGANLNDAQKAFSTAPISHGLFFGSILSMEAIFFLYYYSWNLFQMLPVAGAVGLVAFVSGSKALSEVQSRRMAGER